MKIAKLMNAVAHPPRFEKGRKMTIMAQLQDTEFHRAGAGLPIAVTVSVALVPPLGRTVAWGHTALASNPQPTRVKPHGRQPFFDWVNMGEVCLDETWLEFQSVLLQPFSAEIRAAAVI